MTYDIMNRLKTVASDTYGYDPANKRIWKNDEYTFHGAGGERIGRYSATKLVNDTHVFVFQKVQVDEYFAGRRLTTQDRLGSVGSYYPYGEAKSGTVSNADSFATYYRDSTGLDYAQERFYASGSGRFLTSDPYRASAQLVSPTTWNRYSYVTSDPINYHDPLGLDKISPTVSVTGFCSGCLEGAFFGFGGNNSASWVWHEDNEVLWGYDRQLTLSLTDALWADTLEVLTKITNSIHIAGVSDDCFKELSKLSTSEQPLNRSAISTAAKNAKFLSGVDSPKAKNKFENANVHAWTGELGGSIIFWRPSQLGQSAFQSNWLINNVLHELLHTLGYSDTYLQTTLLGKDQVDDMNTNNITEHLGKHCCFKN